LFKERKYVLIQLKVKTEINKNCFTKYYNLPKEKKIHVYAEVVRKGKIIQRMKLKKYDYD
jgi:hypothetical protein